MEPITCFLASKTIFSVVARHLFDLYIYPQWKIIFESQDKSSESNSESYSDNSVKWKTDS